MSTTPEPEPTGPVHALPSGASDGPVKVQRRWTAGRVVHRALWVMAAVGVFAMVGTYGWSQFAAASRVGALNAAFPEIAERGWACSTGEASDDSGGRMVSCSLVVEDPFGPTVNFEVWPAPEPIELTVRRVAESAEEMNDYDQSGYESTLTLAGVDQWAPEHGDRAWGWVARWRSSRNEPGLPATTYFASLRYAQHPYGVTVYASSSEELDEVIGSLNLKAPDELPS